MGEKGALIAPSGTRAPQTLRFFFAIASQIFGADFSNLRYVFSSENVLNMLH